MAELYHVMVYHERVSIMSIKDILVRTHFISNQFGIDPRKMLRSLRGLPRYARDLHSFRTNFAGHIKLLPCLHDWYQEAGITKSEYFWQDLLVARMIFLAKPDRHVDIGSRIDGFAAHVASFREIEIFDIRPLPSIPGVLFKQVDLMEMADEMENYCDSLSCLHALEHFGLGRYSDPVDPKGFERGLVNMSRMLKKGGTLYLSVPIGIERVEFNAHRVSDPRSVIELANKNLLRLSTLTIICNGRIRNFSAGETPIKELAKQDYSLGIFIFVK